MVAVVQLCDSSETNPDELLRECAEHIARYKLPKDFVFTDSIERSPSGKADYRWAKQMVEQGLE